MHEPMLRIPRDYVPLLDVLETERAIKLLKDSFERELAAALNLRRVTAPLFVLAGTGINDDLNGVERPVSFPVAGLGGATVEIVQSLAKWKRLALAELGLGVGEGIYTDMNAVRPDETLDELHSCYVDQWDWERVIAPEERTVAVLEATVRRIYAAIRRCEAQLADHFPQLRPFLPEEVTFVHAETLARRFPGLSPRERETQATAEYGAVFIIGIGAPLPDGRPHDGRAPDYDDWITPNGGGRGLNGDLLVRHPVLACACELSSMGIRVTPESLLAQLAAAGCEARRHLHFHRRLLAGELPLTMGGGIGQSRLAMVLLRKAHIGEVQASVWPAGVREALRKANVALL